MLHDALLCAAALGAGVLNTVAGGGTFLTLPALVLLGVPPVAANATSTVAVFPGYLGGALGFRGELAAIDRRLLLQASIVGLAGGLAGAGLLMVTSNQTFRAIVPWLLLFATLLFAAGGLGTGARSDAPGRSLPWRLPALAAVAVYGGYFNGGLGILLMAVLSLAGIGNLNAVNGLKNLMSFLLSAISVLTFAWAGLVHWREAILMMAFSTVGGYVGAAAAKALPLRVVRAVVIAIGLGMSGAFFLTHNN
ncbi:MULTISPECIES: sulfite exporter TauE/SafE family protein [unclassified Variovorax]|uniref:sulfite exporter TauE/SafE family protein n=1 Tax=unclassified Variovorax TaxID=663243 RepID=UPI0013185868|nr:MULTISPECIES: sulfite exporter TauE/SafE family protein [unclassified Variovorax]VTU29422.1 Sulfite exporter TauE/SafE [Variovorax sp. SRS16]VTU36907.1 Sulfite exporter TauE/SafE [Variovorax sp. PBL-E5]